MEIIMSKISNFATLVNPTIQITFQLLYYDNNSNPSTYRL